MYLVGIQHLWFGLSSIILCQIIWSSVCLARNYHRARKIGLPVVISPFALLNPLWIIIYKLCPPILPLLHSLPLGLGRWARYAYMGWQYDDKFAVHRALGRAFVLCAPGGNEVIVADPAAAHAIMAKRKEFVKPEEMYGGLDLFGKNLDSAEGEVWQRHRRITAPSFNEKVSASVWQESIRQTGQLLDEWLSKNSGTRDVVEDTASLTVNVFTYAGFGIQHAFKDAKSKIEPPHELTYRDALYSVLRNFTLLVFLAPSILKLRVMSQNMRNVGKACEEFELYMKEMVDREKGSIAEGKTRDASNLLRALVQASQAEQNGLSDQELYGNLFIYNLAGHESTANTIATSIAYLAADPQWQRWLCDEIQAATKDIVDGQEWKYEDVYPKLTRCRAVMLETLRLHGSTVFLPKMTRTSSQLVKIDGVERVIPQDTLVTINSQALHCDPETWGEDAVVWRPDRWIAGAKSGALSKEGREAGVLKEELVETAPGTFVGWAGGPRICPGKKFSQVEFAAVLAALFRDHEVLPKPEGDETAAEARRRLVAMIDDSAIMSITLQMRRPRDVALVWRRR